LGKILRINPSRDPKVGGFTDASNGVSNEEPTIYAPGLRNPFTLLLDEDSDLFVGDVGNNTFEEINCVYFAGENYGWPLCEGPCNPTNPNFRDPTHGYSHDNLAFDQDSINGPKAIMANAYYLGSCYGGEFTKKIIYSEFYDGWIRLLTMDVSEQVSDDHHIGHLKGLVNLHVNPADGLLYGTSLGSSDQIQRMVLQ